MSELNNVPMPVLTNCKRGRKPVGFYFIDTAKNIYYVEDIQRFSKMTGISPISLYKLTSGQKEHIRGLRIIDKQVIGDTPFYKILRE